MENDSEGDEDRVKLPMTNFEDIDPNEFPILAKIGTSLTTSGEYPEDAIISLEELQSLHLEIEKMIRGLRERREQLDLIQQEFETSIEHLKKEHQQRLDIQRQEDLKMELEQQQQQQKQQEAEKEKLRTSHDAEKRKSTRKETQKLERTDSYKAEDDSSMTPEISSTGSRDEIAVNPMIPIDDQIDSKPEKRRHTENGTKVERQETSKPPESGTKSVHGAAKGQTNHRTGVQENVTHQKIANQIPITTFWNSVEPYFRKIGEEDLKLLEATQDHDPEPYLIPLLGPHYLDTWMEKSEIGLHKQDLDGSNVDQARGNEKPRGKSKDTSLSESLSSRNSGFCQPLTERVLASLIDENLPLKDLLIDESGEDNGNREEESLDLEIPTSDRVPADLMRLEERIKRELYYMGFLELNEEIDYSAKEDDDICGELRYMQKQLREQVTINNMRKKRLIETVRPFMAHQDFTTFLQEVNSSLEQSFIKRYRVQKTKHRKKLTPINKPLPDNISKALHMRKDLIRKYGPLFPKDKFICPEKSIFVDLKIDEPSNSYSQPFLLVTGSENFRDIETPNSSP